MNHGRRAAIVPVVGAFLAGAAGLMDEIAWARALGFRLGTTTFAAALVLSALVCGWGLGARLAGALRASPRRILLVSQVLAAVGSLVVPRVALARWPLALLLVDGLLLALTFLGGLAMGMALPALLDLDREAKEAPRRLGRLTGANGIGSMVGALVAGFALLPLGGLDVAAAVAALAHLSVAALGAAASKERSSAEVATRGGAREEHVGGTPWIGRLLSFYAGFAVVAVQLLAMRWLMLYFLGFGYVLSAIVALALGAYGLGGWCLAPRLDDPAIRRRRVALASTFVFIGLVVAVALLPILPGTRGSFSSGASPAMQMLGILLHAAALVFLPIFGLAGLVPLAYAELAGSGRRRAGEALAWNGLGSALAPWLVTLWWIPAFGSLRAWGLLAVLAPLAALTSLRAASRLLRQVLMGVCGAAALVVLVALAWPGLLTGERLLRFSPVLRGRAQFDVLSVDEDASFAVTVVDDGRRAERTLFTDNFRAAGTGDDYRYMRFLGSMPLHFEPRARRVLVIAFGTGTTAGTVARSEQVTELDIVEISPAVLSVRQRFAGVNGAVDEERAGRQIRWHVTDGRRFLEATSATFDAVSLEPLLPYAPGAVHFYTREFYRLVRERLQPAGTLTHWIPATSVSPPEVAALVRTFAEEFERAGLWLFGPSLVLVGSRQPLQFAPGIPASEGAHEVLAWITDREGMLAFPPEPTITDAHPWIEFLGTRSSIERLSYLRDNLDQLLAVYREDPGSLAVNVPSTRAWIVRRQAQRALLEVRRDEEDDKIRRTILSLGGTASLPRSSSELREAYEAVRRQDPDSPIVVEEMRRFLFAMNLRVSRELMARASRDPDADAVLRSMREVVLRTRTMVRLAPYRFEGYLYQGAAAYILDGDPDLSSEARDRVFAEGTQAWIFAAAVYPGVAQSPEMQRDVEPLMRRSSGGVAEGMRRFGQAATIAEQARRVVPPGSVAELVELLDDSADLVATAVAFRALQVDRALWRRRLEESEVELPTDAAVWIGAWVVR